MVAFGVARNQQERGGKEKKEGGGMEKKGFFSLQFRNQAICPKRRKRAPARQPCHTAAAQITRAMVHVAALGS